MEEKYLETLKENNDLLKQNIKLKKIMITLIALFLIIITIFGISLTIKINQFQNSFEKIVDNISELDVESLNSSVDLIYEKIKALNIDSLNGTVENVEEISSDIKTLNDLISNTYNTTKEKATNLKENILTTISGFTESLEN